MTASTAGTTTAQSPVRQLLDADVVAGIIAGGLGERVSPPKQLRLERCWPGNGGGLLFQWSFVLDGRRCNLYVRPAADSLVAEMPDPVRRLEGEGQLRGVLFHVPQYNVLFHTPDCDPQLPHLVDCLSPAKTTPILRPFTKRSERDGRNRVGVDLTCRLLSYKPGRRALIGYEDTQDLAPMRFCGKTYRTNRRAALSAIHRELNAQLQALSVPTVRVPVPLGHVPELRLTLFSWADGEPGGHEPQSLDRAVDALAVLHAAQLEALPQFTAADEVGVLLRWHQALGIATPSVASEFMPALSALQHMSQQAQTTEPVTIHRDFYEAQIVCTPNGSVTILDLDTIACGDPCLDLGNLIAHACLRSLRDRHQSRNLVGFVKRVIDRYARSRYAVDPLALKFYLGSSLLRIAMIHTLRTRTRRHARSLYKMCARIVLTGLRGVTR